MTNDQQPLVYFKDNHAASFAIDLTPYLVGLETAVTASVVQTQPATSPALTHGTVTINNPATSLTLPLDGGVLGTTYGMQIQVTTSNAATIELTIAVLVDVDLNVPYSTKSPNAFQ